MSAALAMSSGGAVLVAADSHDSATAFTPGGGGGGISITVMVPIASISGATRATLDQHITSSTSIEVRATGENAADARADVGSLSVFGASGAVAHASIDETAVVEAIVGAQLDAGLVGPGQGRRPSRRCRQQGLRQGTPDLGWCVRLAGSHGGDRRGRRRSGRETQWRCHQLGQCSRHRQRDSASRSLLAVVSVGLTASMVGAGSKAEVAGTADVEATAA